MGQSKTSLKELLSVKRKFAESIDDYLNRFRLLKIRKKLDTRYLRDMAQLADRVRQVEKLKAEKARVSKDGQVLVPPGTKVPPLEQRKKQEFCKYHNFLGHKTSQCFLFRDLIQNVLNEGRLKFSKGKSPMKIDSHPLQVDDASYVEPIAINIVKITEDFDMVEFKKMKIRSKQHSEKLVKDWWNLSIGARLKTLK
ncbi:uncharacterized protein LOC127103814 [Lathyrus oleraceus]|uniref:uncharacterized protein LOC127103814 n=1 Tax=Pisum sativum TaxID=3888 RepID=UPI0021CF48CD|nr:uncharacterized protein LOC127103814 [Pisum sativum]